LDELFLTGEEIVIDWVPKMVGFKFVVPVLIVLHSVVVKNLTEGNEPHVDIKPDFLP
jgi:hypothetical protein